MLTFIILLTVKYLFIYDIIVLLLLNYTYIIVGQVSIMTHYVTY